MGSTDYNQVLSLKVSYCCPIWLHPQWLGSGSASCTVGCGCSTGYIDLRQDLVFRISIGKLIRRAAWCTVSQLSTHRGVTIVHVLFPCWIQQGVRGSRNQQSRCCNLIRRSCCKLQHDIRRRLVVVITRVRRSDIDGKVLYVFQAGKVVNRNTSGSIEVYLRSIIVNYSYHSIQEVRVSVKRNVLLICC